MNKVKDVIAAMEAIAPPWLAVDGDPIGLHVGSPERPVRRVAVSLDASLAAMAAAVKARADMLVVHHPRFYRGLITLAETDPAGGRAAALARSGLAVYSAHTNLDMAPGGTNDLLAEAAGLQNPSLIVPEREERLLKLAVFVPAAHAERVRRAVCAAGAGAIGNYSDCTFRVRGTGTFRCGEGTKPFQGRAGSFEEADEYRLETVFPETLKGRVIAAMLKAHPYEEAAYDIYPMVGLGKRFGFGRLGELRDTETLSALAARMAKATGSTMTQYAGKPGQRVRRLAVWAGAGVAVRALVSCGADAVVAGEMGYHDVESFLDAGVGVVTLGHGFSEELVLKPLATRLQKALPGVAVVVKGKGALAMRNALLRG